MTDVLAWVACTASTTVLNTGTEPSNRWPPFPGVTPATTFVPYSIICFAWNDPSRPVIPCTTRRVDRSLKTLMWPFLLTGPPPASLLRPCPRSEEHTSELQSQSNLVCRLLLEKKKINNTSALRFEVPAD